MRGFTKAIIDAESGRIPGGAVLGIQGGEIAGLLQIAMMVNILYGALRDEAPAGRDLRGNLQS